MANLTADRSGTSPIGTTGPNASGTGNTDTSYAIGAFTSGTQNVSGTTVTVQNSHYDGILSFNASGAITVTLNSSVKQNFKCFIANLGSGTITLTPTLGALVNGASSLTFPEGLGCQVFFAQGAWTAFAQATTVPVTPQSITAVTGEYLNSYNATTGLFTLSTPAGLTTTVALAKLTTGGANGSLTVTGGLITGYAAPT